jgi:hypothetical protein
MFVVSTVRPAGRKEFWLIPDKDPAPENVNAA